MSALLSSTRQLWRTIFNSLVVTDGRELARAKIKQKFLLMTAISGHDNKHTFYRTQLKPKWSYGDDACFVASHKDADVIGLADGVGGWRTYNIDPSLFSRNMMKTCEHLVNVGRFSASSPVQLIGQAYEELINCKIPVLGSATTCVISLSRGEGCLYAANLGDSGFLVIRKGRVVVRSETQKHAFNTPFQLALLPPHAAGQFHKDRPQQAMQTKMNVEPGDLIVAGTDGLFDNLSEPVILQEVNTVQDSNSETLQACADRLVERAKNSAKDPDHISPFANEARRYGINFVGGNPGDITVVIGLVVVDPNPPSPPASLTKTDSTSSSGASDTIVTNGTSALGTNP